MKDIKDEAKKEKDFQDFRKIQIIKMDK